MCNKRYIMTGGDNGYCCECGGLCDRVILEVDDKAKAYKVLDCGEGFCLGKYCWIEKKLNNGMHIVHGYAMENEKGKRFLPVLGRRGKRKSLRLMTEEEYMAWREDPADTGIKVTIKGNKYGKDGEFGDKLDTYVYVK